MTNKILALSGLIALLVTPLTGEVETGKNAPDFTLTDTTGKEHSLSDFEGQYVVLEWFNQDCPFVKKHYDSGNMQDLQKSMTDEDVVWLQVISSAEGKQGYVTPSEGETLREEKNMHSTAMLLDTEGKVGRAYDARVTPHMYLINPEGELVYQGAIDSISSSRKEDIDRATNFVVEAYKAAKNGEKAPNPSTKAYGCSVKY